MEPKSVQGKIEGQTVVSLDDLFKKKGELVTQIEIATNILNGPNGINAQIQSILNIQPGLFQQPKI